MLTCRHVAQCLRGSAAYHPIVAEDEVMHCLHAFLRSKLLLFSLAAGQHIGQSQQRLEMLQLSSCAVVAQQQQRLDAAQALVLAQ